MPVDLAGCKWTKALAAYVAIRLSGKSDCWSWKRHPIAAASISVGASLWTRRGRKVEAAIVAPSHRCPVENKRQWHLEHRLQHRVRSG
jgi:hypothetical protein